jgi:poly[ADP-ribose] polymerase 16
MKCICMFQFDVIKELTGHTDGVPTPNFIFEVVPSEAASAKFEQIRQGRQLFYGYHGTRLENFHSILHNGLAFHMNKVSMSQ